MNEVEVINEVCNKTLDQFADNLEPLIEESDTAHDMYWAIRNRGTFDDDPLITLQLLKAMLEWLASELDLLHTATVKGDADPS